MHGISLAGLRYCLQTHEHADHLDPSHFLSRSASSGVPDAPHLHFYAPRAGPWTASSRASAVMDPSLRSSPRGRVSL